MQSRDDEIILVEPTTSHKQAVLEYRDEFTQNGETVHGSGDIERAESFETWLQACIDGKHEATMPKDRVPATQYLAIRVSDNRLVGMLQIRHSLNKYLKQHGGHIGYSVRKSQRRKGYATKMLKSALVICKTLGLQRVLLTCDPANVGSARVMKANGGIHEKQMTLPNGNKIEHYWISIR
jgi:predicted acetyltransferase